MSYDGTIMKCLGFFVLVPVFLATGGCSSTPSSGTSGATPEFYQPTRMQQQQQVENIHRDMINRGSF